MFKFWRKEHNTENIVLKCVKIILWIAPCILLLFLLNKHFVPFGTYTVAYDVKNGSPSIKNFASKEPDKLIGTSNIIGNTDYFQLITVSPLYFDVKVPRPFAKATVTLKYQNTQSQEVIQLGSQQSNKAYAYYPIAYMNSTLNSLGKYWHLIRKGDIFLWQKNTEYNKNIEAAKNIYDSRINKLNDWKKSELSKIVNTDQKETIEEQYTLELEKITQDTQVSETSKVPFASIDDFLANIPPREQVAQYNYDLSKYYEIPGYHASSQAIEISHSLRGKHEIYTYIGDDETLNFSFVVQDINRHVGEDSVTFSVYNPGGEVIKRLVEPDDGNLNANGKVVTERIVNLTTSKLPHGMYRILMNTNDDIFFKKIITFQHLVMFKGVLYLTDNVEYKAIVGERQFSPTTVYTNSSSLTAYTAHQNNFQTLRIGSRTVELDKTNIPVEVSLTQPITSITTLKNDVHIQGNGYFAFSKDQLFDPDFSLVASVNKVDNINDYGFIIANYPQPTQEGDWFVSSATVQAPQLFFDKGADLLVHFIINLPNLHETGKILKIKELTVTFEKPPITIPKVYSKLIHLIKK